MALASGLVEFWKLNEASGSRAGSLSAFNLADSGTTPAANFQPETNITTQSDACANFSATTVLSVASAASLQLSQTQDLTISAWCNINNLTVDQYSIVAKAATGDVEYILKYANFTFFPGTFQFQVGNNSDAAGSPFIDPAFSQYPFAPVVGSWYHLVGVFKALPTPTILLYVQNQRFASKTISNSTLAFGGAKASKFAIGANMSSADVQGKNFNGKVCNVGIWSRALHEDEIGDLYNGGLSLCYPFTNNAGRTV